MDAKPTISRLELLSPSPDRATWVHLVSNLLSPSECRDLITLHDPAMITHQLTLTTRQRAVFEDADLAELLWTRLSPFFGSEKIVDDEDGSTWVASHLNTRFRYCKYEQGGSFEPHCDGRRLEAVDEQSFLTVNTYLIDVPEEMGGATRILSHCDTCTGTKMAAHDHVVLGKVVPTQGQAAVFRDNLFHDGEELRGGVKYLLRTDVMFKREEPFDLDKACMGMGDEQKGKKALAIAVRLEDGGNFDDAIKWYKKAWRLWPALEKGDGG